MSLCTFIGSKSATIWLFATIEVWSRLWASSVLGLAPGTSIGHYDVTALLGEGGMGQVCQARDTKLDV